MKNPLSKIIYPLHNLQKRSLKAYFNMLAAGTAAQGAVLDAFSGFMLMPGATQAMARTFHASSEMLKHAAQDYPKPSFGIYETTIDGKPAVVTPETVLKKDFGSLMHFKRDTTRNDPKVLIISAMSGHYATIFRDTVAALLPNHDVYIVDWENARDVPASKGDFGLDDYVHYVQDFIKAVGPETNVIGVSQSTVPLLAAVSLMAAENAKEQPLSMTLICGPIDTRVAEASVMKLAKKVPAGLFENNIIEVPKGYKGEGRRVYPGFLQVMGLMSAKPLAHVQAQMELFTQLSFGNKAKANDIKKFYDEYFAVCDLAEKFALDTVDRVFLKYELATGKMSVDGKKVEPEKISKTALLTIEGTEDNLTPAGQTVAAHKLCSGLKADQHYHHLQQDADHYGLISGPHWRKEILPRLAGFIHENALKQGFKYDPVPQTLRPESWTPANDNKPLLKKKNYPDLKN